ncbi:MAG: S1 RNA-binding domain-containing protein [Deltaproteobacteria bacterium]|nr:S1 RNA-binding domain-containing protein [Deltaproteobacteria bacterium]MCW5804949.1 S1 RNA-binding domain-containing protein [Deltaproteobacteria bacterium]
MTDEDDFAAMFAASEASAPKARRPRVGDIIKGKVISLGKDAVFVDAGGKAEGVLDRSQVSDGEGKLLVKVGDTIEARVVADAGGVLQLRVKLGGKGPEVRAELQQAQELGIPVEGTVTEVVKGGVSVDVAGVRGFCPASQIDARFVEKLEDYLGQKLTFKITRYEPRNLVLSRRALVEEEKEKLATETRKKLEPGAVLRGKVVGFKPFGAFVDLGGIEGMLHVSELGYSRVERPEDVLALGQELDVAVLKVETNVEKGKQVQRISLSLKALASDPWRDATAKLAEGMRVKGKVTRLQPFGAFVEIAPAVEGLVHISELGANRRINHPKEVVQVGQDVEAVVLSIDHDKRRLALSMSASKDGTAEDVAEAGRAHAAPAKLGTLGDLLARKK